MRRRRLRRVYDMSTDVFDASTTENKKLINKSRLIIPMVWWFFKKRDDKRVEEKLKHLNNSLSTSFSNIKRDLSAMNNHVSDLKSNDKDQDEKIEELQSKIDIIFNLLEENKIKVKQEVIEEEEEEIEVRPNFLNPLTDTQKLIFIRLNTLQKENKGNQIAIKHLAQELYPNKNYDAVRSTLSEYLGILIDLGLVDKSRKGKQTYVYITNKGSKALENIKEKKLKNINKIKVEE